MPAFAGMTMAGFVSAFIAPPAQADGCAPPRLENTVPMEAIGDTGEVALPITLNGMEEKFLFDTGGGTMNYIRPELALKLGMFKTDNFPAMDLNGNASYSIAGARHVTFGGVTTHGSGVMFQEVPGLGHDGILSAGTMTGDDLDMDFGAMRLNFFSAAHCAGDVVYWPHTALAVVPVTLQDGHFALAATLDGHAASAVMDTGSPWTILNLAWAEKNLGFTPGAATPPPGVPKDEPDQHIYFRKYAALSFPGIAIAHPLVAVRPMAKATAHGAPDLVIGMEVLRHLHLYYAAREQKLYITPATADGALLPEAPTPSPGGHAWPENSQGYSKVWDPIHRPH